MENKDSMVVSTLPDNTLKLFTQKLLILIAGSGIIYMLYLLGSVLSVLFFSSFLTILFSPFLTSMNRRKIPDWLGIIFIFLGILLFFFIALFAILPIFAKQIILLFSYIGSSFGTLESLYKSGGVDAL
jgi:predicted PurR-regulated permease PerM